MPKTEDSPLDGKNFYAIGKRASESYISLCSLKNVQTTSLRLFNIYGPGQNLDNLEQGMLSIYLAQALDGNEIIVKGALDRSRDFVYIDDLIRFTRTIEKNESCYGKIINICSGREIKVSELINILEKALHKKLTIANEEGTPGDINRMVGCNKLLKKLTGIDVEIGMKDGITRMLKALNSNSYYK